jgi:hypothetical protein
VADCCAGSTPRPQADSAAAVQVRKHADKALDILVSQDPGKETMIRELKFKTFNQEWLEVIDQNVDGSNGAAAHHAYAAAAPVPLLDPPPLLGLYDDDETAAVLGLLEAGGRPPLAPKATGSAAVAAAGLPSLEEAISGDEGTLGLAPTKLALPADEEEALDDNLLQEYV